MSKKIKNVKMPELSANMPVPTKKRGRPRKGNKPQHAFVPVNVFNPLDEPKKKMGRPRKNPEPQHAFIPVDAFNPLDPDYDELYVNNMPNKKKKMGRPRKNPVVPVLEKKSKKKIGRPRNPEHETKPLYEKKCKNCDIEFLSISNKNKFCSVKCRNKDFYDRNYKRKSTPINQNLDTKVTATEKKPLENFTKRTVIVGESNQKESLALEFSNQRVEALKADNKKLLEINNEKIVEIAELKSELKKLKLKEISEYDIQLANEEAIYKICMNELSLEKYKFSKAMQLKFDKYNQCKKDKTISYSELRSLDVDITKDILSFIKKELKENQQLISFWKNELQHEKNYASSEVENLQNFLRIERQRNKKYILMSFFAFILSVLIGVGIGVLIMFGMANL